MSTISVVIRCFNEERHIGRLLEGIAGQTVGDVDLVVVDSGSTDGTPDVVARYPARIVRIPPEEFSFGRSLNRGCAAASGEVVVIASAHVYPVFNDWIERLTAPFLDADVALVYGRQRGDDRSRYSECQVFAQWFGECSVPEQDHPFCNNANAAIRRNVWERLPYDETLTGLEDIAWARAAKARGHRIVYEATAEVVHVHEETARQVLNRYRREGIAMRTLFPEERFSFAEFVRLFIGNVWSDLYHARHDRRLARSFVDVVQFRLMQFWGTYRGFAQQGPLPSQLRARFYYPRTRHRVRAEREGDASRRGIEYAGRGIESRHEPPD